MMTRKRHEIVARLKVILTWDYVAVQMMHLMILSSVAAFWMTMRILLRRRLLHSHQTDRTPAPMKVLHHRTSVVNCRILRLWAMDATTMPLWVVPALVVGAPTIVAPIRPVAVTVLVAVCHHVGIATTSSSALRVTQTLPGTDLVTRTSSLIASLSARSNRTSQEKFC
jgi:hypothetical protein